MTKKKSTGPAYPRTLYVREDKDGDDVWYISTTDPKEHIMDDVEGVIVGVYELVSTERLSFNLARTQLTGIPRRN